MKTLRSKFLVTLIATLFLCLSLAIAFAFNNQKAYADVDNDTFAMVEGAEIALNKDGLRFRVQMGQNVYDRIYTNDTEDNVKLSVLIAPKSYFDALNATANAGEYQLLSKKIEVEIDNQQKVYQKDGYYFANAVLTNLAMENNNKITKDQFDFDFVAVGCIATTDGETTSYEYASFFDGDMANNVRSQYELAQAAVLFEDDADLAIASDVLAEEGPYGSWIGSENYPINVDEADEYSILQAKVAAGLVTNAKFNVYNKFGLESKENLPANTTLYHYVNFYNNDQVLQTLEVKEGDTAEFPANAELPKYLNPEARGSGYVHGWLNTGWVNKADGAEVSLSTITNNVDVKIKWTEAQLQKYLLEDLRQNEPDTVFSYDTELGISQVGSDRDSHFASRSFDTTKKLPGQRGTTKITWTNSYNYIYLLNYTSIEGAADTNVFDYSRYDLDNSYMVMDMYAEFPEGIDNIYVKVGDSGAHGAIKNNTWGKIVVPLRKIAETRKFFNIHPITANSVVASSGTVYLAKAYVVTGDKFRTIAEEDSFNIGSMAMAGAEFFNHQMSEPLSYDIFTNDYFSTIQLFDGQLFYTNSDPLDTGSGVILRFAEPQTGMLYFTVRGFAEGKAQTQIFNESGSHVGSPWFSYVDETEGGYSVYSLNLEENNIKSLKLYVYLRNAQVWIKDISTTNPLA